MGRMAEMLWKTARRGGAGCGLWKSGEKVGGKAGGKVAEKSAGRSGKVSFAQVGVEISTTKVRMVERFARRFAQGFTSVMGRFYGFYT